MTKTFIVSTARTPIGKLSGSLASFSGAQLGGLAITAALQRAGLDPAQVDHVIMGQVLQAGAGQNPARQAASDGGIPMTTPAVTVNKVCLSGLYSIHLAEQMIRTGEAGVVIAGGMESMTNAPYLLPGARAGYRLGDAAVVDGLIRDGLWCAFDDRHMGAATDGYAERSHVARRDQDEFAAWSHERAATAVKEGRFDAEIVGVEVPQRKGPAILVESDEGIRPGTTAESLSHLKPAFSPQGTITAGNASQLSDGAAAVIVVSEAKLAELGLVARAELVGYGMVAGPDPSLLTQPSAAIMRALHSAGLTTDDVELFEINEAFAVVALASMSDLGISPAVVNINGGAIALGHPIGMSGTRLAITMVEELNRRGGGLGAVALCGGGGQGDAALLKVA
ncbi:MAG: acetyl-CoA C-acetyltransferase [Actinomycetota bacterium]|nr:acetyl-CoA C-acetyltransferase [Actinomycetota bacterium]